MERGAEIASSNLTVLGAFVCGAAIAWCAKYVIFDK